MLVNYEDQDMGDNYIIYIYCYDVLGIHVVVVIYQRRNQSYNQRGPQMGKPHQQYL